MDRVLTRLGRTEKDSKNDGSFVFAISLIVASLTMLYKTYMYLCSNLNTFIIFFILGSYIILMTATFISMSLFIFTKAISLEVKSTVIKKKLETYATNFYLIGFLFGTLIITYLLVSYALKVVFDIISSLFSIPNTSNKLIYLYIVTLLIILKINFIIPSLFSYKPLSQVRELYSELYEEIDRSKMKILFTLVIFFAILIFYIPVNIITIEMSDIYSNENEQIPIDITVTGQQFDYITVDLSKADTKDNLKIIDSFNMKIDSDPNKVISSEYLIGNNLEFGRYKFYINSKNLSEGYYELSVTTKKEYFDRSSSVETKTDSFYLV
nr:hypothetical protein [Methanosarcina mazei]